MLIDSLTPKEIEKLQGTLDIVEEQDEYVKAAWDILSKAQELPEYKVYERLVYDIVNSTIHSESKKNMDG